MKLLKKENKREINRMTPFRPSPTPRIIASMISSRAIARAIARKHENNEDTRVSSIFKWFAMIVAITFGLGFGLYVGAWIAGSLNNIHLALRIVFLVLIVGGGIGLFELFMKLYKDALYDEAMLERLLAEEQKKQRKNNSNRNNR